jgi:hypothetical protein
MEASMSIDSIKSQILGLTEPVKQGGLKAQGKAVIRNEDSLDQVSNLSIQKALSIAPQTDMVDISQIRRELDSGLYDSPEMIRAAARQIAKLGI